MKQIQLINIFSLKDYTTRKLEYSDYATETGKTLTFWLKRLGFLMLRKTGTLSQIGAEASQINGKVEYPSRQDNALYLV